MVIVKKQGVKGGERGQKLEETKIQKRIKDGENKNFQKNNVQKGLGKIKTEFAKKSVVASLLALLAGESRMANPFAIRNLPRQV